MPKKIDPFREEFARFLEKPSREGFRDVLKNHYGELRELDFKAQWPEDLKLAKHILGLANSEGGCLVIGVSETAKKTLEPTGLASARDKADVENGIRRFLPQALMDTITVMDFNYKASEYAAIVGKSFQILIVPNDPQNLPFLALRESTGIRKTEIYVRRMASTETATYEELQAIINRRIATGHSTDHALDLNEHLDDLRKLYGQIEHVYRQNPMRRIYRDMFSSSMLGSQKESFEQFIERMIDVKKRKIEGLLCG